MKPASVRSRFCFSCVITRKRCKQTPVDWRSECFHNCSEQQLTVLQIHNINMYVLLMSKQIKCQLTPFPGRLSADTFLETCCSHTISYFKPSTSADRTNSSSRMTYKHVQASAVGIVLILLDFANLGRASLPSH